MTKIIKLKFSNYTFNTERFIYLKKYRKYNANNENSRNLKIARVKRKIFLA
jgi:hypothetical protein